MPSAQKNLQRATELAFDALAHQTDEQFRWLGADRAADFWRLPVLNDVFQIDTRRRRVFSSAGSEVGPAWRILALHYLAVRGRPEQRPPEVTFADIPTARSYAEVYRRRTTLRLCAGVGRSLAELQAGAAALGARAAVGGDAAFDFLVFPRLSLRLIWQAPDEEFPPLTTLLVPANIGAFFCAGDIVVVSESLVSRLCGRPF